MKVVSNSEASRIAGVSRQAIQDLKRINTENKRKYPFFGFDPETGKPGINIDHREWQNYLNRNHGKRVKKKQQINNTDSQVKDKENGKTIELEYLQDLLVGALRSETRITNAEIKAVLIKIERGIV